MAQNPNLKFLYHIICMLITVMLLYLVESKTLFILFFMRCGWLFRLGDVQTGHVFVIIQQRDFTDDRRPMQNNFWLFNSLQRA